MTRRRTRWLDDDEQQTWRTLIVAMHELEASLDRQLQRDAGLPHAHYAVLVALSESDGGRLRMGELAEQLHYSPSRLAHAVTRLTGRGWVRREPCPDDARGHFAVLTGEGLAALEAAAPGHVAEVRRLVLDPLSRAEQQQLRTLLGRVVDATRT